jgi:hypothetical protein
VKTVGRDQAPFEVRYRNGRGAETLRADAVIDASGTSSSSNPAGVNGSEAIGEAANAPTFLMMTGYEQVRSIVADIAGDKEAAERVELVLPETGVCIRPVALANEGATCCGGPAPVGVDACCQQDAEAKATGARGCGCS